MTPGQLVEQPCQDGGAPDKLLEVVQRQQHLLPAQRGDHLVERIGLARQAQVELARQARADGVALLDVVERHETRAVAELRAVLLQRAPCEPRLADAAGTDQRHQAAVGLRQQLAEAAQLDRAADETAVG